MRYAAIFVKVLRECVCQMLLLVCALGKNSDATHDDIALEKTHNAPPRHTCCVLRRVESPGPRVASRLEGPPKKNDDRRPPPVHAICYICNRPTCLPQKIGALVLDKGLKKNHQNDFTNSPCRKLFTKKIDKNFDVSPASLRLLGLSGVSPSEESLKPPQKMYEKLC
jgi:hypothetical protein